MKKDLFMWLVMRNAHFSLLNNLCDLVRKHYLLYKMYYLTKDLKIYLCESKLFKVFLPEVSGCPNLWS